MIEEKTKLILKSIDIYGFKSYEKPVHIDFSVGINIVLSPVCTGKTNLFDAIRWAMCSPALNYVPESDKAEVLLTVSGTENSEISIKRVVSRQPDGVLTENLFIDEKTATPIDVQNLFKNISFSMIDDCNIIEDFEEKTADSEKQYIVATLDAKIAKHADTLIGITINETGGTDVLVCHITK